jgi:hypothetical protein
MAPLSLPGGVSDLLITFKEYMDENSLLSLYDFQKGTNTKTKTNFLLGRKPDRMELEIEHYHDVNALNIILAGTNYYILMLMAPDNLSKYLRVVDLKDLKSKTGLGNGEYLYRKQGNLETLETYDLYGKLILTRLTKMLHVESLSQDMDVWAMASGGLFPPGRRKEQIFIHGKLQPDPLFVHI